MLRLDLYDGAHRRTLTLDRDVVRVGRDAACDLVLPADDTVSRVHAELTNGDSGWQIIDCGSRNGTFVNGRRLAGPARLSDADRVLIGNYVLVLRTSADEEIETVAAEDGDPTRVRVETGLSARELEVLRLLCAGDSDQQIADTLFISVKTVQSHLDRIRTKTGARRRAELLRFAMDHGIA
jgi:DNA-binding CsgD family transcriptional regulator